MTLKSAFLKAAINISIMQIFPEAVIVQGLSSASLDFLADCYEDKKEKKHNEINYKLAKLYEKYFAQKYLDENGFDYKKIEYYKSQILDILAYSKMSVSLLAECNNDIGTLCDYMVSTYRDNCLYGVLEEEADIRRLFTSVLTGMIDIICSEPCFLLDGILALYPRVSQNEKEIKELKRCVELMQQKISQKKPLFPQFITNTPYASTRHFIGRKKNVDDTLRILMKEHAVLLFGIGGIGKTEIAKQVIKTIMNEPCKKHDIEKIAWVDYDNQDVESCIARGILATSLIEDKKEAWRHALRVLMDAGKKLLLVIDNVERLDDENLLRLTQLPCKILLTSRVRELADFSILEVEHLSRTECVTLFQKYYTKQPDTKRAIEEIVDLADYHTVTVELLAKIANLEECSLTKFLERLKLLGFKLSDEEVMANHEKLHKEEKIIQQLAKLFSIVHFTKEEASLIVPVSVIPAMAFSYVNAREWLGQKNHKNLERLVNTGWLQNVSKDGVKYYMIHSVIASAIRFQYQEVLYEKCRDFMARLTKEMQYPDDEHGASKKYLIQFCWSINDLLENHMNEEKDADFLLYLSRIYCDVANFEQAFQLLRRCVHIYKKSEDSIEKLISCYNQIGIVYQGQDKNKYSLTQYAKAFKLADKYPIEGALWVTLLLDAALVFLKTDGETFGGFADCYFREAYNLALKVYGNGHSEIRKIKTLWSHCIASYDPATANQNFLDIIQEEEQIYSADSMKLAETYASYAIFLYEMGEYPHALDYTNRAYNIKNNILGEAHPETIDLRNYRGLIMEYMGEHDKAKEEFEAYLEIVRKTEGEESTMAAVAYNNLAMLYFDSEEYHTALVYFKMAENIYRNFQRLYNEDFAEGVATALRNEGQCYTELAGEEGENPMMLVDSAVDKFKEALIILNSDSNRYKFDIAQVYGALASAYVRKGWARDAELSFKRAIQDTIDSRNKKHPGLAYLYHNYAMLLDDMDRKEEAVEQLVKAEEILTANCVNPESEKFRIVRSAIAAIKDSLKSF